MSLRSLLKPLHTEAAQWPGVDLRPLAQRNHTKLEISYRGRSRKIVISSTASDHRTSKNNIALFRRTCRELGAEKNP